MSPKENLRHTRLITALSMDNRVLPISPAPAVAQPHAKRLRVSHPVDMHAHAIISAPMRKTKNEPIANLRIQGIVQATTEATPPVQEPLQILLRIGSGAGWEFPATDRRNVKTMIVLFVNSFMQIFLTRQR